VLYDLFPALQEPLSQSTSCTSIAGIFPESMFPRLKCTALAAWYQDCRVDAAADGSTERG